MEPGMGLAGTKWLENNYHAKPPDRASRDAGMQFNLDSENRSNELTKHGRAVRAVYVLSVAHFCS